MHRILDRPLPLLAAVGVLVWSGASAGAAQQQDGVPVMTLEQAVALWESAKARR